MKLNQQLKRKLPKGTALEQDVMNNICKLKGTQLITTNLLDLTEK